MTITVYIRLGQNRDKKTRRVTFKCPPDIPHEDVLEHVTAIDGQECVIEVVPKEQNLYKTLLKVEKDLYAWLKSYGYEVRFT